MMVSSKKLLEGYLHGDAKYNILPLPAPVQLAEATTFVNSHLAPSSAPGEMVKLSRVAIFHDLRETAAGFERLLTPTVFASLEPRTAGAVIAALAWLGDAPQAEMARNRFAELVKRTDFEQHRETLCATAFHLADNKSADLLRRALAGKTEELRAALQQPGPGRETVEIRIDQLDELAAQELKALEDANRLRADILANPEIQKQVRDLVDLYLEIHPHSTSRLVEWAAFRLVRLHHRAKIADVFLEVAARYPADEDARQTEPNIVRARVLRAMQFFGQPPNLKDQEWLRKFGDVGTDILALRPDWEYSPYHSH
jgi:hypothetical protein